MRPGESCNVISQFVVVLVVHHFQGRGLEECDEIPAQRGKTNEACDHTDTITQEELLTYPPAQITPKAPTYILQ